MASAFVHELFQQNPNALEAFGVSAQDWKILNNFQTRVNNIENINVFF